jgi:hypothetical protein
MLRWGAPVLLGALAGATPSGFAARAAPPADTVTAPTDLVPGVWRHHKATLNYFGITSLFTCDGLEDHVRQLILYLGARKDAKVRASGCPGQLNAPSRSAWVDADFYSLAAATDADGADTVKAHWTNLAVTPRRPDFMGDGDCELIQEMKDFITKNFSLRNLQYRADCVPHEQSLDSYAIKGEVLKEVPSKSNGARN